MEPEALQEDEIHAAFAKAAAWSQQQQQQPPPKVEDAATTQPPQQQQSLEGTQEGARDER